MNLIAVSRHVRSVEAHLVADELAELRLELLATRAATLDAAIRRGCVQPMRPSRPRPIARQSFGSCVVLPEPVSPATITTWCSAIAVASSSVCAEIGSSVGNRTEGSSCTTAPTLGPRRPAPPPRRPSRAPAPARATAASRTRCLPRSSSSRAGTAACRPTSRRACSAWRSRCETGRAARAVPSASGHQRDLVIGDAVADRRAFNVRGGLRSRSSTGRRKQEHSPTTHARIIYAAQVLEIGSIVAGKLRIERVLGEGGMGVVAAATHLQLDQRGRDQGPAARALAHDAETVRALPCARRAPRSRLKSEHVVRVIDVGTLETARRTS